MARHAARDEYGVEGVRPPRVAVPGGVLPVQLSAVPLVLVALLLRTRGRVSERLEPVVGEQVGDGAWAAPVAHDLSALPHGDDADRAHARAVQWIPRHRAAESP